MSRVKVIASSLTKIYYLRNNSVLNALNDLNLGFPAGLLTKSLSSPPSGGKRQGVSITEVR